MPASASAGARANSRSALIGEKADLTYPYDYLGAGPGNACRCGSGKHAFAEVLEEAEHPLIIVGAGALARPDGAAVAGARREGRASAGAVKDGWNGFSVLHTAASRVGALDIGFVPGEGGKTPRQMAEAGALDVLFLLGADEIDMQPGAFVVYIGTPRRSRRAPRRRHPAGRRLHRRNPALYVNTEGRVQMATAPPSRPAMRARTGRSCARCPMCSAQKLPYDLLPALRAALFKAQPHLARIGQIVPSGSRRHPRAFGA